MTRTSPLTETDIRRWCGETYFQRGQSYYRQGAIIWPRREGDTLKAQCHGSQFEPYRVEATLDAEGIASAACSCPLGVSNCKHVAALLLTWLHHPDSFTEMATLEARLAQRSPDELIGLIRKMINRYPDLEDLLDLPRPAGDATPPLSADVIRRQLRNILPTDWDYGLSPSGTAMQLQELVELGEGYEEQQNWRDAVTVYETILRETLDSYEMFHEEDGSITVVVNDCVSRLGQCLETGPDQPVLRQRILRVLFDTYRWDVEFGGIDMGYEAPEIILEQITDAEREVVVEWVEAAIPSADESWGTGFRRQTYGGFLLELQAEELDDEAFLVICRETDQIGSLIDRLLSLGRVEEAAAEARQLKDYELLNLAPFFKSHGQADLFEQLVRERLANEPHRALVEWLRNGLVDRGDLAEALSLQEQLFWQRPSLREYEQLAQLAQPLERWAEMRTDLLARLAKTDAYSLLTEIHLAEENVEAALKSLPQAQGKRTQWRYRAYPDLAIRVARAAEESQPDQAIKLYLARSEALIESRGRSNYAQAATYLSRIREIYHRLGEIESWEALIRSIRQENRQLPALQDELNQAGL